MFNRILSKIGEAAKSPQSSPKSPDHETEDGVETTAAEGFLCPSCMLAFPSAEELQNHYEVAHGQEVNGTAENRGHFLCPACKMRFGCDQELQSHFTRHHTEKGQKSHEELSSLRQDLEELQTSLKEERWYSEELKQELGRVQSTIKGAGEETSQAAVELFRSQVQTLEESKTLALSEVVILKQHLEEVRADKDILRDEKSKLEQKTAALSGEYASVQALLDEVKSENDLLKSKLSNSQVELERLSSEIHQRLGAEDASVLRQELASVHQMMDKLTLQTDAEKQELKLQCHGLEQQKLVLEKSVQALLKEGASSVDKAVQRERDAMQRHLKEERSQTDTLRGTITTLQGELNKRNTLLEEKTEKMLQLSEAHQDLGQQLLQMTSESQATNDQLSEKQTQVESLQKDLSKLQEQFESMSSSKDQVSQQLLQGSSRIMELEEILEQKQTNTSELEVELVKLRETVERLESERSELCTKIEAGDGAKTAISQFQQENASLQDEVQQQQQLAAKASQKNQQKIEALNKQLNQVKLERDLLLGREAESRSLLEENKRSLTEAASKTVQHAQDFKALHEKFLTREKANEALKKQVQDQSQQLETVSIKLELVSIEKARTEDDLKQTLEQLSQEKSAAQELHKESTCRVQTLDNEKMLLLTSLHENETSVQDLEARLSKCMQQLEETKSEHFLNIQQLESQIQKETDSRAREKVLFEESDAKLLSQLDSKKKELNALHSALVQEQERFQKSQEALRETILERDGLNNTNQDLEAGLRSLETEVQEERRMKERSQQQLNSSQAQLLESQEHGARTAKALEDLQELKEEMREKIQQLESECAQLSQAKENLSTLKIKMEQQLEEHCKKEQDLVVKGRSLEQENIHQRDQFNVEKLRLQEVLSEANTLKQALEREKLELQTILDSTLQELKQTNLQHEDEAVEIQKKLSESERLLNESKEQLTLSGHRLAELETHIEEERSQHEAQVCVLQENQSTLRQDLCQQQDRAQDLHDKLAELAGHKLELDAKLENALDERRALLERCLRSEEDCDKLRNTTGDLRRKLDDTLAALHELGRENQTLQIENSKLLQRKWTDDADVTHCTACKKMFTVTLRKHHCRSCGSIFCNDCSSKSATLASYKKPVRVCESCFEEVNI